MEKPFQNLVQFPELYLINMHANLIVNIYENCSNLVKRRI